MTTRPPTAQRLDVALASHPVHVAVGPVPSSSALAYVAFARGVVADIASSPEGPGELPPELVRSFDSYLTEWNRAAEVTDVFRWDAELPAEQAEYQIHAFYRVVARLAEEADRAGEPLLPPAAEEFYNALVVALIDALERSGPASAEYAEHLRSFWPGLRLPGDTEEG